MTKSGPPSRDWAEAEEVLATDLRALGRERHRTGAVDLGSKFQSQGYFDEEAPVRSRGRRPGHRRIYRGRSDERRQALEQCGGQCSKGRPQHTMLQYGRYCARCRCNRMALVLRGSPDWVWLDSVGLSPRGALTKGTGSSSTVDLPASTRKLAQSRQHPPKPVFCADLKDTVKKLQFNATSQL